MGDVGFDEIEAVLEGRPGSSYTKGRLDQTKEEQPPSLPSRQLHSRSASRRRSRSISRRHRRSNSQKSWGSGDERRGSGPSRRRGSRSASRRRDRRQRSRHRHQEARSRSVSQRKASLERREAAEREHASNMAVFERHMKEEDEKRKKEFDEARRDDLTVLILNLSLKATDREVWKFFSERAGKVRDIQVIRDSRSGKSKGVGYVEFYAPQSVLQALALSGSYILDIPIVVQASQAEKNRAARVAKQQAAEITEGGPMKIYVGGLIDSLSTLTDSDLKQLFSPFGEIVSVDVHKDPYTGRCKGYGFVQFRHAQDAREAMAAMNGFEIGGQQIKVGYATDPAQRPGLPLVPADSIHGIPLGNNLAAAQHALQYGVTGAAGIESQADNERLDDEGGGLLSGVNPRISLMQKLQRLEQTGGMQYPHMGLASAGAASQLSTPPAFSSNICLETLFTPADVATDGIGFLDEVAEDVKTECSKYGIIMKVWVNRKAIDGKVWVKFGGPDQAVKAHQALNGRYFAGNRINVSFVSEGSWQVTCVN